MVAAARLSEVQVADLTQAWLNILSRARHNRSHAVVREALSVRAQMSHILRRVQGGGCRFSELFGRADSIALVVVNFIALLELIKEGWVRAVQDEGFGDIHIQAALADGAAAEGEA